MWFLGRLERAARGQHWGHHLLDRIPRRTVSPTAWLRGSGPEEGRIVDQPYAPALPLLSVGAHAVEIRAAGRPREDERGTRPRSRRAGSTTERGSQGTASRIGPVPSTARQHGYAMNLDFTYVLVDVGLTLDNAPVLQSQILDRMRVQRRHGIRVGLVATVESASRFSAIVKPLLDELAIPYSTVAVGRLPGMLLATAVALRRFARAHPSRAVYVRGLWGSVCHFLAFPFGGPRLIYDMRGDVMAEARHAGTGRARLWVLERLVRWAIGHADELTTVSSSSAALLASEYGRPGAAVIPSCVDACEFSAVPGDRAATRAELGLTPGQVLLVYAGGLSRYQMIPDMLRLWAELERGDPDLGFLLLTNDTPVPDRAARGGSQTAPASLIHRTVPRAEVPRYLGAADVAFLLREPHPLNSVASPVKFAEYLACGLAVVSSLGLGDVSRVIEDTGIGVLVSPADREGALRACLGLIDCVRGNREEYRKRAEGTARTRLDWNAYVPVWRDLIGVDR